ncbi:hypothetical protein KUCAC02_007985, partial [Chaenocephalus aceratus]
AISLMNNERQRITLPAQVFHVIDDGFPHLSSPASDLDIHESISTSEEHSGRGCCWRKSRLSIVSRTAWTRKRIRLPSIFSRASQWSCCVLSKRFTPSFSCGCSASLTCLSSPGHLVLLMVCPCS